MYERYKDRGLAIVGISQDTDRQAWLDAVEKDGLPWIHVSDLRENREVKRLYGMDNAVPYTVVVDRSGRIVATLLRGAELEAAIVRELEK